MTSQVLALILGISAMFFMSKAKSRAVRIAIGLPCIAVMTVVVLGYA